MVNPTTNFATINENWVCPPGENESLAMFFTISPQLAMALAVNQALVRFAVNGVFVPMSNQASMPIATPKEGEDLTVLVRFVAADKTRPASADVDSMTLRVYDEDADDPTSPTHEQPGVVSTDYFDTLQLDGLWGNTDTDGYDARWTIDGQAGILKGGRRYTLEATLATSNEGLIIGVGQVLPVGIRSVP